MLKGFAFGAVAAALTIGGAASASAAEIVITDVETGNGDLGDVSVAGYGSPWTTPILMTDQQGQTFVVFCDDLNHIVYVGGGQDLPYHVGPVTVNGLGQPLSESVSNEMGQLADIGRYDYSKGNEDGAIAAQAAIWGIEYDVSVTSSDPTTQAFINEYLEVKDNGKGWASGLISDATPPWQDQILGGVPEPSVWLMLMAGLTTIGAGLRLQRRRGLAVA